MSGDEIITIEVSGGSTWLPRKLVQAALHADTLGPEEVTSQIVDMCNAWALLSRLEIKEEGIRWGWQVAEMIGAAMKEVYDEAVEELGSEAALEQKQDECLPELRRVLDQTRADIEAKLAAHLGGEEEPPQDRLWLS